MIFDEYEMKYLINQSTYEEVIKLFSDKKAVTSEQTNYYYDTRDQKLRRSNITARIREKDGKLTATIKEHFMGTHHSTETTFRVDVITRVISYNGENLYLYGKLHTKRMEIDIGKDIKIMLDYNVYLGTEDYELEIEYESPNRKKALDVVRFLESTLGKNKLFPSSSKSNRFYKNLFNSDRN